MKFHEMFPSRYVSKADLPHPKTVTVADVRQEEVWTPGGKQVKTVLYFQRATKGMILNPTNGRVLFRAFGDSTAWIGKAIELYVDPSVTMKGRQVGGIRLRMPAASAARPTATVKPTQAQAAAAKTTAAGPAARQCA